MAFCIKSCLLIPSTLSSFRGSIHSSLLVPVRGLIQMPVEWKRPDKLPFNNPIKTGDGDTLVPVDMNKSPIEVEKSKEFEKCNDLVKKLFSFHFLGRRFAMRRAVIEAAESVQNHKYDTSSLEVLIAKKTIRIRNLMEHVANISTDKPTKVILNHLIQRRRRHLRLLRKYDYKRFEWLLEKMDLIYTPIPEELEYVQRRKSIRRLADKFVEDQKARKLDEYKKLLQEKRADFLRDKVESLKWIRQEEIDCGVNPTVNESDIKEAEEKLQKHLEELQSRPVIKDESRNILSDV